MRISADENIFKSSYFKSICPGYEQFFEPEKLFLRLTDDAVELKRRQRILHDLLKNPKLFEDLCFLSDSIIQLKSALNDMPGHDLGDFRLNLERFNDADGVVELIDRYLKTSEYAKQYPWLNNFAKGLVLLSEKRSIEKISADWKQIFYPEEHMHACDYGFNLDDILWPTQFKLLAMREQEYTKKKTVYKIEQIKMPAINRIHATLNSILNDSSISYRMEGDGLLKTNDNQALMRRDQYNYNEKSLGAIIKINSVIRDYDEEFGKIMDEEFYSKKYILKAVACQLVRDLSAADAPARIKYFITTLIAELEPLVTEFVPYLCATKTALYWREKGISYCIPEFGNRGEVDIQGLINPYIAENMCIEDVVENDVSLNNEIAVVTGANRGGKTAFVTSVTLCQILFQLGFPVPAKSAKLGVFSGIVSVFAGEEQGLIGIGRLGEELKKLAEALNAAKEKNTFICLNEPLTGTSSRDGSHILAEALCMLKQAEATGFVVTHLLGLAKAFDKINESAGSTLITLTAQSEGEKPLYKIIPAPAAETSHAKSIVYGMMCNFVP